MMAITTDSSIKVKPPRQSLVGVRFPKSAATCACVTGIGSLNSKGLLLEATAARNQRARDRLWPAACPPTPDSIAIRHGKWNSITGGEVGSLFDRSHGTVPVIVLRVAWEAHQNQSSYCGPGRAVVLVTSLLWMKKVLFHLWISEWPSAKEKPPALACLALG